METKVRKVKGDELARRLAKKTNFYIKNMNEVVSALSEVIVEVLREAEYDENVRLYLSGGFYIEGTRVAEHESIDPRDHSKCITPEKVIPKAVFNQIFRDKLFKEPHGYQEKRLQKQKRKKRKKGDGTK